MIEKVVRKGSLREFSEIKENLAHRLSKSPEERVAAVEQLRRQPHGSSARLRELLVLFNVPKIDFIIRECSVRDVSRPT